MENRTLNEKGQKTYLIASLKGVIQQVTTSPSLLSAHIRLLVIFANGDKNLGAKFGRLIEKYTEKVPQAAQVWLARLDAARVGASSAEDERALAATWKKARNSVSGKEEDILKVWLWGLEEAKLFRDNKRIMYEVRTLVETRERLETHKLIGITKRKHGQRVVT